MNIGLCVLAAGLAAVTMQPAIAGCTVAHVAEVPFTTVNGYVLIPVTMNDTTGNFLVDTGAAETLVDSAYASKAGVGMDRRAGQSIFTGAGDKHTLPIFHGHVRITAIGAIRFQDWEYGILDMSWLTPGGTHVDGLLGVDFMHYFDIGLDFTTKMLTVYRLSDCKDVYPPSWKGDYDTIPLKHTPDHNLTLPVFVDDALLDLTFDTGAGGSVLLTRDAAAKAGVDAAALANGTDSSGQGVGGAFKNARHRFKQFLVGSAVYPNATLAIENERTGRGETDGLIGLAPLNAERVWISFTTSTLFVQRAAQVKPAK